MLIASFQLSAQHEKDTAEDFNSIEYVITTLYSVISGDAGVERDWDLFKSLFTENAKLIPANRPKEGIRKANYISPEQYVESAGAYLKENGFHEIEINRVGEVFGDMAHLFSTYAGYRSNEDTEPFVRGINSIQLMNDGTRWWIVNIYWMPEDDQMPIPKMYLPN